MTAGIKVSSNHFSGKVEPCFSRPPASKSHHGSRPLSPWSYPFSPPWVAYLFYGEQFDVPFRSIFLLSFIVGIVGGIYGVGGGAFIAPFLVTFFRLPVYTVAGAAR